MHDVMICLSCWNRKAKHIVTDNSDSLSPCSCSVSGASVSHKAVMRVLAGVVVSSNAQVKTDPLSRPRIGHQKSSPCGFKAKGLVSLRVSL